MASSTPSPGSEARRWDSLRNRVALAAEENPEAHALTRDHGGPEWLVEQLEAIGPEAALSLAQQADAGVSSLADLSKLDDLSLVAVTVEMVT